MACQAWYGHMNRFSLVSKSGSPMQSRSHERPGCSEAGSLAIDQKSLQTLAEGGAQLPSFPSQTLADQRQSKASSNDWLRQSHPSR